MIPVAQVPPAAAWLLARVLPRGVRHAALGDMACHIMDMPYWALEREFGNKIRRMTDEDDAIVKLLGEAGTNVPHIAFIQCHACVPIEVPG